MTTSVISSIYGLILLKNNALQIDIQTEVSRIYLNNANFINKLFKNLRRFK